MLSTKSTVMWQTLVLLLAAASTFVPTVAASPYYGYGSRRLQGYGYYSAKAAHHLSSSENVHPQLLPGGGARRVFGAVWEPAHAVPLPTHLATTSRTLTDSGGYYGSTGRRLSSYYGGYSARRLQSVSTVDRQLRGYYAYGTSATGRRLMSVAATTGRSLMSYGLYGGYGSGRRLSSYYGGYSARRLQTVGPTMGRRLSYYYGSSIRRLSSLQTAPLVGRRLSNYYGSR